MQPKHYVWKSLALIGALALASMLLVSAQAQGLSPASVEAEIADGGSVDITKTVTTPTIPPNADICFLADTTASMGTALASVQAGISGIMSNVLAESPNAEFCAAQYKDNTPDSSFAFNLDQGLTTDTAAVQAAVGTWTASGGGDLPEDQLHALTVMAGASPGWRAAPAAHILVWFGDCPGHDPASGGETLASTTSALTSSGSGAPVIVLAVSVDTGVCSGSLDETGQATAITTATGGVLFSGVDQNAVSDAIASALAAVKIPVTVAMQSDCSGVVTTTFAPASQVVNAGEDADFTETISVSATPDQQGQVYECNDWATINGEPMTDANGVTIYEHKTITVPDTTPPSAACVPTTNPSGKNVPTAPANGGQGQNQDGFYQLLARDNVDASPQIFVTDNATGTVFGPFVSGTKIKLTQAPGADPTIKDGPGVIDSHITIQGDAVVTAVDSSGNVSDPVSCLVPPRPQ